MHVQGSPRNFQLADSYSGSFFCTDESTGSKSSSFLWTRLDPDGSSHPQNSMLSSSGENPGQVSVTSPARSSEEFDFENHLLSKSSLVKMVKNLKSNPKKQFNVKSKEINNSDAIQNQRRNDNICEGCRKPILTFPRYIIDGKLWHEKCKSCASCREVLENSCFVHRGKLYCKKDYLSLRMRCDGCGQSVSEKEMSVTSHNKTFRYVHHVGCCICITCKRSIRSEECHFYYNDNTLVILQCNNCWEEQKKQIVSENSCNVTMNASPTLSSDETDCPIKSPSYLLSPKSICDDDNVLSSEEDSLMDASSSKGDKETNKNHVELELKEKKGSKRPRTILTGSQRNVFKSVFETTQKPNKKQREDLARNTGLTARVVQVWFQNQRAKIKKLSKRQQTHDAAGMHPPEMLAFHGFDSSLKLPAAPPPTDFMAASQYEELRMLHHPHTLLHDANYHSSQPETKWSQHRQDLTPYCLQLPYTCTIQELTSSSDVRFTSRFNTPSSVSMTQDLRNASEPLQNNFQLGGIPDYDENMFKSARRESLTEGGHEGLPGKQNLIHSGMDMEATGSDVCLMQNPFFRNTRKLLEKIDLAMSPEFCTKRL